MSAETEVVRCWYVAKCVYCCHTLRYCVADLYLSLLTYCYILFSNAASSMIAVVEIFCTDQKFINTQCVSKSSTIYAVICWFLAWEKEKK